MAIKTAPFSGWQLSGEDAKAFLKQIKNPKPNKLAQKALAQGNEILNQYLENGYAVVKSNKA